MRTTSARHRARPNLKHILAWLCSLLLLAGFVTFQSSTSARANTVTVSDVTNSCQFNVSSPAVTINSTSISVSLVGARCVIQFLTVGSYSVAVPANKTSLDYLVVGGGGGGGSGGGGGGGVLQGSNLAVTPGASLNLSVGAGGAGGSGGNWWVPAFSTNGGSSTFSTITALGGGSGGQGVIRGGSGGSGGGARYDCTSVVTCIGFGTFGQGNDGAPSTAPGYGGGGGGGGAGGAGLNAISLHIGGRGGEGLPSSITGVATYFGGGGGGGINQNDGLFMANGGGFGGLGGGGNGSSYGFWSNRGTDTRENQGYRNNSTAGAANTGGGGGGTDPEDAYASPGGSGIVVLSFLSPASQKTLTLDSNDGSGGSVRQELQSGISTAIGQNRFSRAGYVFQGWNTDPAGTGTFYANLAAIAILNPTTLYAQWVVGVNRTITFNANQGVGNATTQLAGIPTNLFANSFTRTGFTFLGWNSIANGTGYFYADLAMHSFYEDQILYAQWAADVTPRKVVFYGNAATGGTTPSQSARSTAPLNANGFTRTGFVFSGWSTAHNQAVSYLDLQSYSFAADLSLFAIWVAQANRTVTFNGNPATTVAMANQTSNINAPFRANTYVRAGHTFLGWNTLANGTGVNYPNSFGYSFGAAATMFATWGQDITVAYDANQGDVGSAPPSQSAAIGGARLSVQGNPLGLGRTGFILAGWNTVANGSGTPISLWQTNVQFSANTILYAQWVPAVYAVAYVGNQNTSGSLPLSQSYSAGAQGITIETNSGALERAGFLFTGWNTAPDGSGTPYAPGTSAVTFAGDTVLFASWAPLPPPPKSEVTSQSTFGADPAAATRLVIRGNLLGKNPAVTVGLLRATIVSATDEEIVVLLPIGLSGLQPLVLRSPDGTFRYDSLIDYKESSQAVTNPAGTDVSIQMTFSGFKPGSSVLTPAIKKQIRAFVAKHGDKKTISCTGFTEGPTVLNFDRKLSRNRAIEACRFAIGQSRVPFTLESIKAAQKLRKADSLRRVTIVLRG